MVWLWFRALDSGGGAGDFTSEAGVFEFFVAVCIDGMMAAGEAVKGGDEADGRVQAGGVVVVDEVSGDALGVLEVERGERADGLAFEGLMEAFEFSVGLRIVGAGHDVAGLPMGQERFELTAFELGTLVGNDAGAGLGIGFAGLLQDDLGVDLGVDLAHGGADIPTNDRARAAVENGAQKIEDAANIQVAEVDVPVFVGDERPDEAGPLSGGLAVGSTDQAGGLRTR